MEQVCIDRLFCLPLHFGDATEMELANCAIETRVQVLHWSQHQGAISHFDRLIPRLLPRSDACEAKVRLCIA